MSDITTPLIQDVAFEAAGQSNPMAAVATNDPILECAGSTEPDWLTQDDSIDEDDLAIALGKQPSEPSNLYLSPEEQARIAEMAEDNRLESNERLSNFCNAFPFADEPEAWAAFRRFMAGLDDACNWIPEGFSFTILTSKGGNVLSKHFYLENNELKRKVTPAFGAGTFKKVKAPSLLEFCKVLEECRVDQALMYSIPIGAEEGRLTTQKLLPSLSDSNNGDVVARTKSCFEHANGPGIVAIDYDPPKGGQPMTRDELVDRVCQAMPQLRETALVVSASASSYIFDAATDQELRGAGGLRIYVSIRDASDTKRFLEQLSSRLWLIQSGRIEVSASGAKMKRTVVDLALGNPVQPDFAGGASCGAGLVQRRPAPVFLWDGPPLDTRKRVPDLTKPELQAVEALIKVASDNAEAEANLKREAWLLVRRPLLIQRMMKESKASSTDLKAYERAETVAIETLDSALSKKILSGNFVIRTADGAEVTVADVLHQSDKYDGMLTFDPIEPDYDGGRVVGKLLLDGKVPVLHSMAHGGTTYKLEARKVSIQFQTGHLHECVDKTLAILRNDPTVFEAGDQLVRVAPKGVIHLLSSESLSHHLGSTVNYYKLVSKGDDASVRERIDPPEKVARTILAFNRIREMRELTAIVTAPLMLPTGELLSQQGFHAGTGLYLKSIGDGWDDILENPSVDQMKAAYKELMFPFSLYPWASSVDESVALCALLTACVRRGLETAPAFGFDAPTASSGKTKAATAVCSLVDGFESSIISYPSCRSEEEMSKMLLTKAMEGAATIVIDNVVGNFENAAFAAAVTSPFIEGRILGQSAMSGKLPCRMMIAVTGNNMVLGSDASQRLLVARIDAKSERPHERGFGFDPVAYAVENRNRIITAGLTLLQGFVKAGMPRRSSKVSRFSKWDRLVRQCVLWLGPTLDINVADPLDALDNYRGNDPEQEALGDLLRGWKAVRGDKETTAADLLSWVDGNGHNFNSLNRAERAFFDILFRTSHNKPRPTSSSIGTYVRYKVGKIVDGMRLEKVREARGGYSVWKLMEMGKA